MILLIASVASPSDASGARLNEIVTTGNWPWWLTASGAVVDSKWVKALKGTAAPLMPLTAGRVDVVDVVLADGPVVPAFAPDEASAADALDEAELVDAVPDRT